MAAPIKGLAQCVPYRYSLIEYDSFVSVSEDARVQMPSHRLSENALFQVSSESHQILNILPMSHTGDVLVNDGPFIKVRRRIMRRCANQLHTTRVRLMVGSATRKGRQKRVMDVNYRPPERIEKARRKDLHVAREHHEIDFEVL